MRGLLRMKCVCIGINVSPAELQSIQGLNTGNAGPCFNIKTVFPGMGIPIIKMRQS